MAPTGSLLVSYLYDFPEIDMATGERRKPPAAGAAGRGGRRRRKKKTAGRGTAEATADENAENSATRKRRLLVVRGLTSASTVGDVAAHIYRELSVPATHGELNLLVRSLDRDSAGGAASHARGSGDDQSTTSERRTWSHQTLKDIGVVLHPESAISSATPAFHLRTRIAVRDYGPGGKFYRTYREDGGYRRETLSEALSKSWSYQLVLWAFNKHWITRFALITFVITSLVGFAQQARDLLGL
eukprot:g1834.t1